MKTFFALLAVAFCTAVGTRLQAQTLNWGNVVGGSITTSTGAPIDNTFIFQLGAFVDGFEPDTTNTDLWLLNWRMFDQATYDPTWGFSTEDVFINNDVTSSNPSASTMSFAGLDAYIWIRNNDNPVEGSEWLLTRSSSWTFPIVGGDCCSTNVLEWSVSDLETGETPEWGRTYDIVGPGVFTPPGSTSPGLQTFTFVPEPSTALLSVMAGCVLVLRRRRTAA